MATPATGSSTLATAVPGRGGLARRGLLAGAAGTLLLGACGQSDEPASGSGSRPATTRGPRELLVGASLELSGRWAALGVLQERALRISMATLNAEDGVPVGNLRRTLRLVVQDNAGDPGLAARQATELARVQGVHALVGGTVAETAMAIIGVAQKLQVPYLSLAAGDGIVLPLAQRTYIYKLTPDAGDVARRLARLARAEKLGRVTLLAAHGLHGDSGVRAMGSALEIAGIDLVRTVRLPGATDGDPAGAAERAVEGGPDGIVVWGTAPNSGAAARALRRTGYTGQLLFDAGAVAEETLSEPYLAAMEGALVVHPASLGGSTLTNTTTAALARRDFVFRYIREYGGFSGFAPYGSDALHLIANAARLAGSVDRGRLRAYLQSQVTEGIAGAYSFAPIRHGGMAADSLGVFTVTNGAWIRVS
ncbi:ABC transporter substrate-binding protein [Micromonospora sp. CPCC 206060]|uniref:ABC transporter substrate-binding protein n=1 Tax=Micromonospora sp. CPCC 206060 TaxID=3122406 RepID=UPI002FEF6944